MRPLQARQTDQREEAGQLTALGADTVAGLRVLRGIGGEQAFLHRYGSRSRELRDGRASASPSSQATPGRRPGAAAGHLPGAGHLARRPARARGRDHVGDVVAFYGYAFFLVIPMRTAIEAADEMTRALVGRQAIIAVLRTEPDTAPADTPADEPPYRASAR